MPNENKSNTEILQKFGVIKGTRDHNMEQAFQQVSNKFLQCPATWELTGNSEFPLKADVGDQQWKIRVNNFPDEPLHTLLINERAIISFDNWPNSWSTPEHVDKILKNKVDLLEYSSIPKSARK